MASPFTSMGERPSLLSLCTNALASTIIGGKYELHHISELPSDLYDDLLLCLTPSALQELQDELVSYLRLRNCCARDPLTSNTNENVRKRARFDESFGHRSEGKFPLTGDDFLIQLDNSFSMAWKALLKARWPQGGKQVQWIDSMLMQDSKGNSEDASNWQQMYWEAHLQHCLDEAAAQALLPNFQGCIGDITLLVPMEHTGSKMGIPSTSYDRSKLSYNCQQYGRYARFVKLQNVLCVEETCNLLRDSRLQGIVFRGIKSRNHVDGARKLLNQNVTTLLSLEFIHCKLSASALNDISYSLYDKGNPMHGIQHLSIKSSSFFMGNTTFPFGFLSFLLSGRSLYSLNICDSGLEFKFAQTLLDMIHDSKSSLSAHEPSVNKIPGCSANGRLLPCFLSSSGVDYSLKELRVLNLRGNNLGTEHAECLKYLLIHTPQLQSLDISENPIGDDGIGRILVPSFKEASERPCPLVDIKVDNCDLSSVGATQFLDIFSTSCGHLTALSIAYNYLGSRAVIPLGNFLEASCIRRLDIEAIGLDCSGLTDFAKALPSNLELAHINLSKNRGGIGTSTFVSQLILRSPDLLSVDASYNFVPQESLPLIHAALRQSKGKLKRLDLTGNPGLCQSKIASMFDEFQNMGEPVVLFPSSPIPRVSYDDDP
ncbi:uncharacterized protein LOC18444105 isoform X3 [Amborella trichopoda]|uniref:uncharacterized protein LOC18444105 isoform X3 n=1 Tax=Amborella trichopoda TaxID=13333 RepID=UPI0009BD6005|nr:uncharacterized protein LOC18444105 isoform X3 [Amborella trichopoda]|eukprot:XP_020529230.1 uncharacterized protein LOC18444105 isoform X3 [Amborella trichopoda]